MSTDFQNPRASARGAVKNHQLNEPAFPIRGGLHEHQFIGMSLRDYFAAKAMHQFLNGAVLPVGVDASEELAMLAARAYEMADAMLKARAKGDVE